MSSYKIVVKIEAYIDTSEYAIPADGKLKTQLVDDITEAVERANINIEEIIVKVVKDASND